MNAFYDVYSCTAAVEQLRKSSHIREIMSHQGKKIIHGNAGDRFITHLAESIIKLYPDTTSGFLMSREDTFQNPVGSAIGGFCQSLYREFSGNCREDELSGAVEYLVKIFLAQGRDVEDIISAVRGSIIHLIEPLSSKKMIHYRTEQDIQDTFRNIASFIRDAEKRAKKDLERIRVKDRERSAIRSYTMGGVC